MATRGDRVGSAFASTAKGRPVTRVIIVEERLAKAAGSRVRVNLGWVRV